jgi:hypothetical protein
MELPLALCISSPFWSRTIAWPSSVLNGDRCTIIVLIASMA